MIWYVHMYKNEGMDVFHIKLKLSKKKMGIDL